MDSKRIVIINGPNLNLLGQREVHIYGQQRFEDYLAGLRSHFGSAVELTYVQSNHEGAIIDALHAHGFEADGIVLNAGAYTHTSYAIADALSAIRAPVVEVHISNIHAREAFRSRSVTGAKARGCIAGLGLLGYRLAIDFLVDLQPAQ